LLNQLANKLQPAPSKFPATTHPRQQLSSQFKCFQQLLDIQHSKTAPTSTTIQTWRQHQHPFKLGANSNIHSQQFLVLANTLAITTFTYN
jgi:hypothetical protein